MLAALGADGDRVDGSRAVVMAQWRQRMIPFEVAASPFAKGDDRRGEIGAARGEHVLMAKRPLLVRNALEDAVVDQGVETVGEHVGGDAELSLDLGIALLPVEDTAQDPECPHVAEDIEGAKDGAARSVVDGHGRSLQGNLLKTSDSARFSPVPRQPRRTWP